VAPLALGPADFARLTVLGIQFDPDQGMFWLIWAIVALAYMAAKNIVRTRPGRALQAIRDRDVAAALVGIDPVIYKISAFRIV
jgi:branched-chain amino acid transport system permease protein